MKLVEQGRERQRSMPIGPFTARRYIVRGRLFGAFGRLHIEAEDGRPIASGIPSSHWSAFSISVVSAQWPEREQFVIQPRTTSPLSDVVDVASGKKIGAVCPTSWIPLTRDEWTLFDTQDREIGTIREESIALVWLNRWCPQLVPRRFQGKVEGRQVCTLRQHFNPFVRKFEVDCSDDTRGALDPRLVIAVALLLCTTKRLG